MPKRSSGVAAAAAILVLCAATLKYARCAVQAFTSLPPGKAVSTVPTALRGAAARGGVAEAGMAGNSAMVQLVAVTGALAMMSRLARRAEPVSAAAAAAAAAKAAGAAKAAAAAKGATETAGAVAGAAGAGSLSKSGKEGVAGTATPKQNFDPAAEVGATEPLGYWDPAGFSKKGDESGFRNLRAAEIKHGRVAMMAAAGAVAQHFIKFPGFEGVPTGLAAALTPPGSYGLILLFALAGGLELGVWTESAEKEPGNFGDPLSLGMYDTEMRNREINNGRAAMFAAIGIIAAELLTGKDAIEQFGK